MLSFKCKLWRPGSLSSSTSRIYSRKGLSWWNRWPLLFSCYTAVISSSCEITRYSIFVSSAFVSWLIFLRAERAPSIVRGYRPWQKLQRLEKLVSANSTLEALRPLRVTANTTKEFLRVTIRWYQIYLYSRVRYFISCGVKKNTMNVKATCLKNLTEFHVKKQGNLIGSNLYGQLEISCDRLKSRYSRVEAETTHVGRRSIKLKKDSDIVLGCW